MTIIKKEELVQLLENGMTVGDLKRKLSKFDDNLLVINSKTQDYLPVDSVTLDKVDYCYDEIISRQVVAIW